MTHTDDTKQTAMHTENSPLPMPFDVYEVHGMKRLQCQGQEEEPVGRIINDCEQVSDGEAEF